jgi:hypothetical protein
MLGVRPLVLSAGGVLVSACHWLCVAAAGAVGAEPHAAAAASTAAARTAEMICFFTGASESGVNERKCSGSSRRQSRRSNKVPLEMTARFVIKGERFTTCAHAKAAALIQGGGSHLIP